MMESWNINTKLSLLILVFLLAIPATGQSLPGSIKAQTDELLRTLNDSPWAKTQTDTDTSEMFFSPTRPGSSVPAGAQPNPNSVREQQVRNNDRSERGAFNQAISVDYHVRLFSARPIRLALARLFVLRNPTADQSTLAEWKEFVDRDFGPYIVVTVDFSSPDGRLLGPVSQVFASSTKETVRNRVYLERNDGKRLFLSDYRPPANDGIGAKFIFLRLQGGKPFLSGSSGTVRFVAEIKPVNLNVKFNLSEMIYEDRLTY